MTSRSDELELTNRFRVKHLDRARLPARHQARVTNPVVPWVKTCTDLRNSLGTGMLCVLLGPRGTGKTQMAVTLARELIEDDALRRVRFTFPALYLKAVDVFLDIRSAFKQQGATEREMINHMVAPRLLIVDEIQERSGTPWEDTMLHHIIDRRYDVKRDTLLIGNLKPEALPDELGSSVLSRVMECGEIIQCEWGCFRKPTRR